jgi:competence protein ComEA
MCRVTLRKDAMKLLKSLWLALALVPCLAFGEPVDLNTADAATLARELKGIGEVRARAIVEHRTRNGPFRSVDELALVKGIGSKVIATNRANLRVERKPPAPRTVPPQRPAQR